MDRYPAQQLIRFIRSELSDLYSPREIAALSRVLLEELKEGFPGLVTTCKINHLSDSYEAEAAFFMHSLEDTKGEMFRNPAALHLVEKIVERLKMNEPVQYVLGRTEFFGLMFKVTPDVLIPRPETEELVEWVISEAHRSDVSLLDIGTGSGCIAIALGKNLPKSDVYACDISAQAIEVAKHNARENGTRVHFFTQDIFLPLEGNKTFDSVISNPPYIPESEKGMMDVNVLNFEPLGALFVPDHSPLLFYERIADLSLEILNEQGKLYFEINRSRGDEVRSMLMEKGYREVELRNDISGNPRMVRAVKPK